MCKPKSHPIGLGSLVWAFLGFSLVFNPWISPLLPKTGFFSLLLSPQVFFLLAFALIVVIRNVDLEAIGVTLDRFWLRTTQGILIGLIPILSVLLALGLVWAIRGETFGPQPALAFSLSLEQAFLLFVLAPISEELFFRGLLFPALRENYPTWVAVMASALIFMAGHGGFKVGPLVLGLITAPLVLRTGSLWPGMVFHAISNAYGPIVILGFPGLYRKFSWLFQ